MPPVADPLTMTLSPDFIFVAEIVDVLLSVETGFDTFTVIYFLTSVPLLSLIFIHTLYSVAESGFIDTVALFLYDCAVVHLLSDAFL